MFRKKSIFAIMFIIILFTPSFSYASTLEVDLESTETILGDEVVVEIMGKDLSNIVGANIIINYDSSKLTLQSKTININDTDYIDLQLDGTSLVDSDGQAKLIFGLKKDIDSITINDISLATLRFITTDKGEVSFEIDESSKLVKENGIDTYIYDDVTLGEEVSLTISKLGSISGNVIFEDNYNANGEIIELYREGTILKTTEIDSDGTYSFNNLEDGTYTIVASILGYEDLTISDITIVNGEDIKQDINLDRIEEDANRDGTIALEDLVLIGSKFSLIDSDTGFTEDADVNNDNVIDLLDLISISRKIE